MFAVSVFAQLLQFSPNVASVALHGPGDEGPGVLAAILFQGFQDRGTSQGKVEFGVVGPVVGVPEASTLVGETVGPLGGGRALGLLVV